MLEVRNVTRKYNPKKGVPVVALDNVSIRFPEKGMVFLLGKSGSGKSTLLNVLGGLDKCDSGEIIIKGKSSKDFSQSDFDSYRNTYLGFIFQEYNILNEFTVGANIGLALQLQGKKVSEQAINEILEQVDLVGYGARKPSELSGGQKQRVAIARALVKNPEIILADEPTGALDSKTGLQVFDTLKKLSETKLVIVVTHDREIAELYDDRVIELKDGKIISDIEKYKASGERKNDAINIIDNKIIQIKKGYKLTQSDLDLINSYVANQDAIISIDEKANFDLKKFARIDSDGNREVFKQTDESKIKIPDEKNFKLIKSRLPFKNAFKIGASSLKSKPIRLIFTIFLSMVAFAMFGLADTMGSYNKYKMTKTSIEDSKISALSISKSIIVENEEHDYTYTMKVADDDILYLKEKTGIDFKPVYNPLDYGYYSGISIADMFQTRPTGLSSIYISSVSGFYETDADEIARLGFVYAGVLPAAFDEVAISKYTFDHFKKYGFHDGNINKEPSEITSESVFLSWSPKLIIDYEEYKITAIIDTKFDSEHFSALNDNSNNQLVNYVLYSELQETVLYGYHGLIFTKEGFINDLLAKKGQLNPIGLKQNNAYVSLLSNDMSYQNYIEVNKYYKLSHIKDDLNHAYSITDGRTTLSENEFLVDVEQYISTIESRLYSVAYDLNMQDEEYCLQNCPEWLYEYLFGVNNIDNFDSYMNNYCYRNYNPSFDEYISNVHGISSPEDMDVSSKIQFLYTYMESNPDDKTYTSKSYNELQSEFEQKYGGHDYDTYRAAVIAQAFSDGSIVDHRGLYVTSYQMTLSNNFTRLYETIENATFAGVFMPEDRDQFSKERGVVLSDANFAKMDTSKAGNYNFVIAKMPEGGALENIIRFTYDNEENNMVFSIRNGVMSTLSMVNGLIESLSEIFLYVGIGFAVFSALMLTNFISTSISYKKKEIGILRAIGAKSSDVYSIFFNESLLIALINFTLATAATVGVVLFLNSFLRKEYNLVITLLNFGIRQVALMLAVSVAVAVIASFFPVYRVAKKRPVEAIRK